MRDRENTFIKQQLSTLDVCSYVGKASCQRNCCGLAQLGTSSLISWWCYCLWEVNATSGDFHIFILKNLKELVFPALVTLLPAADLVPMQYIPLQSHHIHPFFLVFFSLN